MAFRPHFIPGGTQSARRRKGVDHNIQSTSESDHDSEISWDGSQKNRWNESFTDEVIDGPGLQDDAAASVNRDKQKPFAPWNGLPATPNLEKRGTFQQFAPWAGLDGRIAASDNLDRPHRFASWGGLPSEASSPTTSPNTQNPTQEIYQPKFKTTISNDRCKSSVQTSNVIPGFLPPRNTRVPRDKEALKLQRKIKAHFALLAKIPPANLLQGQGINYTVAQHAQVRLYERTGRHEHGPSTEDFSYDSAAVATPWNKRLAVVFVKSFRLAQQTDDPSLASLDRSVIQAAFMTRLTSIRASAMKNPDMDYKSQASCSTRRNTTINSRIGAAEAWVHIDSNLLAVVDVLRGLPPDCHSEDEKDTSSDEVKYWIRVLPWRNPGLGYLFHSLDKLTIARRFTAANGATKGNWPRLRKPSDRQRQSISVPRRLPINFYDPDYLDSISEDEYDELDAAPAIPIRLTAKLLRLAARYDGPLKNRLVKPLNREDPSLPSFDVDLVDIL